MANSVNEKVKRRYFHWLQGAKGRAELTVVAIERAIHQFEESTDYKDFKSFNERQATGFKKWLGDRRHNGKPLSNTTKYHALRHVSAFLSWLSTQSGYRWHIKLDSVSYLSLGQRDVHEALSVRPRKFPSLEQVKSLVASIDVKT
ncbi:MAG: site-specific integrase, partial [candidate division Zixibacteria bacterium]